MVFAGIYPVESNDYHAAARRAGEAEAERRLARLRAGELRWRSGFGFRCGFLGLLHMEIVQERLEREYDLDLLATAPSVEYLVTRTNGEMVTVDNPAELPRPDEIAEDRRAVDEASASSRPARYIGAIMELVTTRRGEFEQHGVPRRRPRPA